MLFSFIHITVVGIGMKLEGHGNKKGQDPDLQKFKAMTFQNIYEVKVIHILIIIFFYGDETSIHMYILYRRG